MSNLLLEALADTGFGDPDAARLLVRRIRLRSALNDARRSIEELLERLDEAEQASSNAHAALLDEGGGLVPDAFDRVQRNRAVNPVAGDNVREKELLDGTKVVLQFLDTLGVGLRHGLFSSRYAAKRNPPATQAHRLSGDAK
jgi:hypothetical protein